MAALGPLPSQEPQAISQLKSSRNQLSGQKLEEFRAEQE
jgi:hypothetical protein